MDVKRELEPYDSRVIVYLSQVEESWHRIGHIVREVLEKLYCNQYTQYTMVKVCLGELPPALDQIWTMQDSMLDPTLLDVP